MDRTPNTPNSASSSSIQDSKSFDQEFPIRSNAKGEPFDENGKPYKICCVCPETKRVRDECMLLQGSEEACETFILRHQACLRSYGFQIPKPTE
ncbi:Cytochrome c oxidase copper chaperone [Coelomomyces lativittatus]|nr:Cytochrome c oxidase copper chaperone [Coelomomyces lativittatus]KAJ1502132.1 Cytochrome c oxidase copper chaperone [Coelomomyces lativittatus]KAJ1506525.1 Cytochrome c oxidase copper chaperone [Coelomomyces lativittatus]